MALINLIINTNDINTLVTALTQSVYRQQNGVYQKLRAQIDPVTGVLQLDWQTVPNPNDFMPH